MESKPPHKARHLVAARRMAHESRRLIDDEEVVVFVNDVENVQKLGNPGNLRLRIEVDERDLLYQDGHRSPRVRCIAVQKRKS